MARYLIGFNRGLPERAGIAIGDEVEIAIDQDDEPHTVDVPDALDAALEQDKEARSAFDRPSYSHGREYAEWIAEAKRDMTRARRVATTLERLREGSP